MFFEDKQNQINEFLTKANAALPEDNPMYFDGRFITGKIHSPDILFLGINPGHGDWGNLENRKKFTKQIPFEESPCKYIEGYQDKKRFATGVVDVLCDGDISKLDKCAESSFTSYFATPDLKTLNGQLKLLPDELQKEHDALMTGLIEQVQPKAIVLIGWQAFDTFMAKYNKGADATSKKLPFNSGKTQDFYAFTEYKGIPVHGIIHLSAQITTEMKNELRAIFQNVW